MDAAELLQRQEEAAEAQCRQQEAATNAVPRLRQKASASLQQQELQYAATLRDWHFTPTDGYSQPLAEEKTKDDISKLIARLLLTCNWQQHELQRLDCCGQRLEDHDTLMTKDFQWLLLPPSRSLPKPHCNTLMAELRKYLHAAVPTLLMDDGVTAVDLREYIAKIDSLRLRTTGDGIDFSPSSRAHDRLQCVASKVVCRGGAVFVHVAAFVQSCVVIDMMSLEAASGMDIDGEVGRDGLSTAERTAVTAAVNVVLFRCQMASREGKFNAAVRARRKLSALPTSGQCLDVGAISDAVLQVCYAMGCGAFPQATPRWWMKRRTGGTWEDLRQCDDATDEYFKDKLRMSPRVFREIAKTLSPLLQRRVTFYRVPLQPDHIIAYALYRWATGETYDSGTCSFDIGRSCGITAVLDVTTTLLTAYPDKISWPVGLQKAVVVRAFADKGFPNCHGCMIDCTHIYIDKPANANGEEYCDRKRRFSVQAQVVVDINLRVLDVFVGYPGSVHAMRMLNLSSLWARAEEGQLFTGPHVMLPFGVRTNGYLLGDNGYPPSEWIVVPYGGLAQHPSEARFYNKQKTARGAVERAFGRLKGMWRLFLRTHKGNMETLSQQFIAVCILHNILIDAGVPFDDNLLWEVGSDGVRRRVDLGMHQPLRPVCMESSTGDELILRDALAERMSAH
ncbi:hypothetical protein CBR_g29866 [Chara braunii]|uniref:DDE Tnp4 domain-containing protein n=1 Tax=Chara braunii TaxID=69332 RepID=A0A388JWV3_CHABU|nr:hypothetical protein CBR_g29866 [Chara braunii]|eukprot:GBG62258.1 hypothetical protein CBR_g29866 [Chara braunii]